MLAGFIDMVLFIFLICVVCFVLMLIVVRGLVYYEKFKGRE